MASSRLGKETTVEPLEGFQRKYLRGLAHHLVPAVSVGQKGLTPSLVEELDRALDRHELVKVKFLDFKEKEAKTALSAELAEKTGAALCGLIGHTAIFYRPQADPEKRLIHPPTRDAQKG
jgi:RNA-binding protein